MIFLDIYFGPYELHIIIHFYNMFFDLINLIILIDLINLINQFNYFNSF